MQSTQLGPVQYASDWTRSGPAYRNITNPRHEEQDDIDDLPEHVLPKDPRQWTREHVAIWLKRIGDSHGLAEVPISRFLMNGKALCLMTPHMFLSRVPLGGKLLYKDFQLRLCAAMYNSRR